IAAVSCYGKRGDHATRLTRPLPPASRRRRVGTSAADSASFLLSDELHLTFDPDLVRDQHAAGLDRLVPLEPPLPAVELGLEAEPRARLPPGVGPPTLVLTVEHHLHRDAMDH